MKKITFISTLVLMTMTIMTAKAQMPYTKTFSLQDTKATAAGWAYWFIPAGGVADSLNIKMSYVEKGSATHGGHIHNHNELFLLVEGEAIVNLNGKDICLKPGDQVMCPGGSEHSIRRASLETPIKYIMVNTPKEGLEVKSLTLKGHKTHKDNATDGQIIYLVMEGTANVKVDGNAVQIPPMTVCYVPAGSNSSISADGGSMRYLDIRNVRSR